MPTYPDFESFCHDFPLRPMNFSPCFAALSNPSVSPSIEDFRSLAEKGNVVPVYAQLAADFETPLSAYIKISGDGEAFLFESAESPNSHNENGRYSILGSHHVPSSRRTGMKLPFVKMGRPKSGPRKRTSSPS